MAVEIDDFVLNRPEYRDAVCVWAVLECFPLVSRAVLHAKPKSGMGGILCCVFQKKIPPRVEILVARALAVK